MQKMLGEKKKGTPTQKASPTQEEMYHCEDLHAGHQNGLISGN